MKCRGAIFDMDGVLFDTERIYQKIWRQIANENGIELGTGFLRAISGTNGTYMRQVIERYYHVSDGTDIMEECRKRMRKELSVCVPMKKGVPEILEFFQKNEICMAVASSSSMQQIKGNIEKAGLSDYFSEFVSGEEVKHGKPAPDIFLYAADKLGCMPEECVVFEDSENGIKAGYTAECKTVMIPDLIEASPAILPYCRKICRDLLQAKKEVREYFGM